MNRSINSMYFLLLSFLCSFTYLINFYNKIYQCSAVFVLMIFVLNIINHLYGIKKALMSIGISIIISFALLWNADYHIYGKIIDGLIAASLGSVFISTFVGIILFSGLKNIMSFPMQNFTTISLCAVIDGILMISFFINKFSLERVFTVFVKEVGYKCVYGVVITVLLMIGVYVRAKLSNSFAVAKNK